MKFSEVWPSSNKITSGLLTIVNPEESLVSNFSSILHIRSLFVSSMLQFELITLSLKSIISKEILYLFDITPFKLLLIILKFVSLIISIVPADKVKVILFLYP